MTLIDMLRPEQRRQLRQMRYRIYNREYMRRIREQRKLLCVGVDLPIEAGTCGRLVHAGYQRCIHCTRRRWWLLKHAFNAAETSITAMFEEHASDNDAGFGTSTARPRTHRQRRRRPPVAKPRRTNPTVRGTPSGPPVRVNTPANRSGTQPAACCRRRETDSTTRTRRAAVHAGTSPRRVDPVRTRRRTDR